MTPTNRAAYAALLKARARTRPPHHFVTDLTRWDCSALGARQDGAAFVWVLHADGTHLVFADEHVDGGRHSSHVTPRDIETSSGPLGLHWYAWDGRRLERLADAHAATARLRAHTDALPAAQADGRTARVPRGRDGASA